MAITILVVNYSTSHNILNLFRQWGGASGSSSSSSSLYLSTSDLRSPSYSPCHGFDVTPAWTRSFPKLNARGGLRMLNVSGDGVLDVVLGYGSGADGYNVPDVVCDIYFGGLKPCMGGVVALDGRDGSTLWQHWTRHEVFSVSCQADLNGDGYEDCVAGGRAGVSYESFAHVIYLYLFSVFFAALRGPEWSQRQLALAVRGRPDQV